MADKAISELVRASQILGTDLFVLQQDGTAKCLPGQVLLNWLTAAADGHGGINSWVPLKTVGLVTTYRITLADQTYIDIDVVNGRGIKSVKPTSTNGLVVTYTITYNDDTTDTFTVTNGEKGDKGDDIYPWIKYASQKPTEASHSFGDVPDAWIGLYFGTQSTEPTDWQQYTWYQWKGEQGETGAAAALLNSAVEFQVSDSGKIIPSGSWSGSIPTVPQGKYLWTRTTLTFNSGSPVVSYSVTRMGIDGSGSVSSVANVSPDENGNVPLTAENVGAVSNTGGDVNGELRMNGYPISGLNTPIASDQAANMGYVDESVKKAAPLNLLGNSDFLHFVAQEGIGGTHGTQRYAGDRWILDSGTVTGVANADGDGYSNITLNGTIRQKIPSAPSVATVGVEMVSGTASINYANGEVTITSAGGVLRGAMLLEGKQMIPKYQPKGYAAELLECQRYYYNIVQGVIVGAAVDVSNRVVVQLPLPANMRIPNPTITIQNTLYAYDGTGNTYSLTYNLSRITAIGLYIEFSADVPGKSCVSIPDVVVTISADL